MGFIRCFIGREANVAINPVDAAFGVQSGYFGVENSYPSNQLLHAVNELCMECVIPFFVALKPFPAIAGTEFF
jgi:hypothetical protein